MNFARKSLSDRSVPSPASRALRTCLPLLLVPLLAATLRGADLPATTMEHLYYLQTRAEHVRKFKPDEMVEYCIAQKLGGGTFENLNAQLLTLRVELARLLQVQQQQDVDPRAEAVRKQIDMFVGLLREEARKVQNGLVHEGQIAGDTLQIIARAQNASQ